MKKYFQHLNQDLPSALVVFLVAIPLCLGIALASGAPLFSGLIAGMAGGLVVGTASGSHVSVSGPAAGLTVIVLSGIEQLGTFEAFLVAVVLAGVIQLILGFAKAGIVSSYFPTSVIKGMLAGIGLILIIKQIPVAFGWEGNFMDEFTLTANFSDVIGQLSTIGEYVSAGSIIITVIALAVLIIWQLPAVATNEFFKLFPGSLMAVIVGMAVNFFFQSAAPGLALESGSLVQIPEPQSVTDFINQFTLPDFSILTNYAVYGVAFTIAIVASIESLLCIEAADKLDRYNRNSPSNRELKAQGLGNMASGFVGGIPVTSVIVRTTANITSGARTKMSAIIHGLFLLTFVAFIPFVLNLIPLASLAAILFMIGYKLAGIPIFKAMWRRGMRQFLPFITTIGVMLLTDLLMGVLSGFAVSLFFILKDHFNQPHHVQERPGNNGTSKTVHIELAQNMTFLNKGHIKRTLDDVPGGAEVLIDGSQTRNMDHDIIELLEEFEVSAAERNITITKKNIS